MKQKGISQEGLKLIASLTMLLDHMGAVLVAQLLRQESDMARYRELLDLYYALRIIGRMAFPIYCFQLVEGAHYTRNPKKYALRLAIGMVLSELPFDLALKGGVDWQSNSVMVTLLLGFGMIESMKRLKGFWKAAVVVPFFLAAEWLWTDYGGNGILIIAMFALTRGRKHEKLLRTAGSLLVLSFGIPVMLGPVSVPIELFGLAALVPIFCYDGRKVTNSKAVQWGFYLFYPVHLLLLWLIKLAVL